MSLFALSKTGAELLFEVFIASAKQMLFGA